MSSAISFERRELAPGVTLHTNCSQKRKTNVLSFCWVADLGEDVTGRALLSSLLTRGTRSHPGVLEMARHMEMLYGLSLSGDVIKIGEKHVITFRMEFVNDRYLPGDESILADAIGFLREVLTAPNLDGERFPEPVLEQEKVLHQRHIEGLLNNKGSYAVERCLQEMCADEEFRRYEYGTVEDLPGLSSENLAAMWRTNLARAPTHAYFSGDVPHDVIREALLPLSDGRNGSPLSFRDPGPLRGAGQIRTVSETMAINQTKLVLGFRTHIRLGDPDMEPLIIGNGILGLFPHSKLFLNVREAASLCYYASSTLERSHGLLIISSGIDHAKKDEALDLIRKQLVDIQEGNISDEELDRTLRAYDNRLSMLEDMPGALMDIDLTWRLAGVDYDHATYRERLSRVTREEVIVAMRRVELDTIFLLHPETS